MKIGDYQIMCGDSIIGYEKEKEIAIARAAAYAKSMAMRGSKANTDWYVGEVIDIDSNTQLQSVQRSDGSGKQKNIYATYDVIVTSTVAFGKATYNYSRKDANVGAQGYTRGY